MLNAVPFFLKSHPPPARPSHPATLFALRSIPTPRPGAFARAISIVSATPEGRPPPSTAPRNQPVICHQRDSQSRVHLDGSGAQRDAERARLHYVVVVRCYSAVALRLGKQIDVRHAVILRSGGGGTQTSQLHRVVHSAGAMPGQ